MASGWINRKLRGELFNRDEYTCCYCLERCIPASYPGMTRQQQVEHMRRNSARIATLDHVVSQWEDSNDIANPRRVVTACNACNSSKKHTPLETWCKRQGYNYHEVTLRIAERIAA